MIKRIVLLCLVGMSAMAMPRSPLPPYPESTLFMARFDRTNAIDGNPVVAQNCNFVDSWSGTALQVDGAVAWLNTGNPNKYLVPQGTIRFWYSPGWDSGLRGAAGPGTIMEVDSTSGGASHALQLQVSADGSQIVLSAGGAQLVSSRIDWTNSSWHQIGISYASTGTKLFLDGQSVGTGAGVELQTGIYKQLLCLGSISAGKSAGGAYDELVTLDYPATDADIARLYRFAEPYAALGPVTEAEIQARDQLIAQRRAQQTTLTSMSLLTMQPMENPLMAASNLLTGPLRLIQNGFWFTNSPGISNYTQITIACGVTNQSYDIFRTRALIGSILEDSQWEWVGRGLPGQTLTISNEPADMAFYIGASTNDSDGDGLSDAYEQLVAKTNPHGAPALTITSPTNNTVMAAPTDVSVSLSATNYITPFTVTLFVNGQVFSSQKSYYPNTSFGISEATPGNYQITASLVDAAGQQATSAPVNVTVTLPETSALVCWLKPDSFYSGGVGITNWTDNSGASNNATTTLTQAPIVQTNAVNGYSTLLFTNNAYLSLPEMLSTQGEIFAVIKPLGGTNQPLWDFSGSTQPTYYGTNGVSDDFGSPAPYSLGSYQELAGFHVFDVSAQSNSWNARVNGRTLLSTNQASISFGTNFCLGRTFTNGWAYGHQEITEILIYNKVLSEDERVAVGRYLNSKYNLVTNAPAVTLYCDGIDPNHIQVGWIATNVESVVLQRTDDSGATTLVATNSNGTSYLDTVSSFDPVSYTITAKNFVGTTTTTLQTPLMQFASPAVGATYYVGQNITVSLTPYQSGPPIFGNGFTPAQVTEFVNGTSFFTNTEAPWGFSTTATVPMHWNISALTYDSSSNSRFTAVFGINTIEPIDSDGDGVPDNLDAFPYDPTRWTNSIDTNSLSAPGIIITEPVQ